MPKLTLETYARLLANAACRRGAPLGGILAELGVDAADLQVTDASLREEIAALWDKRQGIAAMKFAAAFGAELKRLGPIGGDGAGPTPPEVVPILAAPPEVRETEMPSYLQAPPPAAGGGILGALVLAPPSGGASPAGDGAPVAPAMVRKEVSPASSFAGTADMNLSAIVSTIQQGGLPFVHGTSSAAGSAQAPEPAVAPQKRAPAVGSGTVGADFSDIVAAVKRGALPFSRPEQPHAGHADAAEEPDLSQLPLETFAAVSGALARGESRDAALAKHGLTSSTFDILAKAWAQRFQREPQLLERFKDLAKTSAALGRGGDGRR